MKATILSTATALMMTGVAMAHDYRVGALHIDHPVARATPAGAPVSGGYMTIRNQGDEADRLIGGAAAFAGKVEIHEMVMDGDVMRMREIADGIEIPPGETVTLMPGGLHVMFMQLNETLEEGAELPATLTFEKAGDVEVVFNVESLARIREHLGGGHGEMDHSGH